MTAILIRILVSVARMVTESAILESHTTECI